MSSELSDCGGVAAGEFTQVLFTAEDLFRVFLEVFGAYRVPSMSSGIDHNSIERCYPGINDRYFQQVVEASEHVAYVEEDEDDFECDVDPYDDYGFEGDYFSDEAACEEDEESDFIDPEYRHYHKIKLVPTVSYWQVDTRLKLILNALKAFPGIVEERLGPYAPLFHHYLDYIGERLLRFENEHQPAEHRYRRVCVAP